MSSRMILTLTVGAVVFAGMILFAVATDKDVRYMLTSRKGLADLTRSLWHVGNRAVGGAGK